MPPTKLNIYSKLALKQQRIDKKKRKDEKEIQNSLLGTETSGINIANNNINLSASQFSCDDVLDLSVKNQIDKNTESSPLSASLSNLIEEGYESSSNILLNTSTDLTINLFSDHLKTATSISDPWIGASGSSFRQSPDFPITSHSETNCLQEGQRSPVDLLQDETELAVDGLNKSQIQDYDFAQNILDAISDIKGIDMTCSISSSDDIPTDNEYTSSSDTLTFGVTKNFMEWSSKSDMLSNDAQSTTTKDVNINCAVGQTSTDVFSNDSQQHNIQSDILDLNSNVIVNDSGRSSECLNPEFDIKISTTSSKASDVSGGKESTEITDRNKTISSSCLNTCDDSHRKQAIDLNLSSFHKNFQESYRPMPGPLLQISNQDFTSSRNISPAGMSRRSFVTEKSFTPFSHMPVPFSGMNNAAANVCDIHGNVTDEHTLSGAHDANGNDWHNFDAKNKEKAINLNRNGVNILGGTNMNGNRSQNLPDVYCNGKNRNENNRILCDTYQNRSNENRNQLPISGNGYHFQHAIDVNNNHCLWQSLPPLSISTTDCYTLPHPTPYTAPPPYFVSNNDATALSLLNGGVWSSFSGNQQYAPAFLINTPVQNVQPIAVGRVSSNQNQGRVQSDLARTCLPLSKIPPIDVTDSHLQRNYNVTDKQIRRNGILNATVNAPVTLQNKLKFGAPKALMSTIARSYTQRSDLLVRDRFHPIQMKDQMLSKASILSSNQPNLRSSQTKPASKSACKNYRNRKIAPNLNISRPMHTQSSTFNSTLNNEAYKSIPMLGATLSLTKPVKETFCKFDTPQSANKPVMDKCQNRNRTQTLKKPVAKRFHELNNVHSASPSNTRHSSSDPCNTKLVTYLATGKPDVIDLCSPTSISSPSWDASDSSVSNWRNVPDSCPVNVNNVNASTQVYMKYDSGSTTDISDSFIQNNASKIGHHGNISQFLHQCSICAKGYCRRVDLDLHLLTHAYALPKVDNHASIPNKLYKCEACGRGFCRLRDYQSHQHNTSVKCSKTKIPDKSSRSRLTDGTTAETSSPDLTSSQKQSNRKRGRPRKLVSANDSSLFVQNAEISSSHMDDALGKKVENLKTERELFIITKNKGRVLREQKRHPVSSSGKQDTNKDFEQECRSTKSDMFPITTKRKRGRPRKQSVDIHERKCKKKAKFAIKFTFKTKEERLSNSRSVTRRYGQPVIGHVDDCSEQGKGHWSAENKESNIEYGSNLIQNSDFLSNSIDQWFYIQSKSNQSLKSVQHSKKTVLTHSRMRRRFLKRRRGTRSSGTLSWLRKFNWFKLLKTSRDDIIRLRCAAGRNSGRLEVATEQNAHEIRRLHLPNRTQVSSPIERYYFRKN